MAQLAHVQFAVNHHPKIFLSKGTKTFERRRKKRMRWEPDVAGPSYRRCVRVCFLQTGANLCPFGESSRTAHPGRRPPVGGMAAACTDCSIPAFQSSVGLS
ncbi:uncharacterized protein PHA67_022990 isoform 1-T1 [Liasis olivaceus]